MKRIYNRSTFNEQSKSQQYSISKGLAAIHEHVNIV